MAGGELHPDLARFLREEWPKARTAIDRCDQSTQRLEKGQTAIEDAAREHEQLDNARHLEVVTAQADANARLVVIEKRADKADDKLDASGQYQRVDLKEQVKESYVDRRHLATTLVALIAVVVAVVSMFRH